MLLYVVFILLSTTALVHAECDRVGYWNIFDDADTSKDGKVDLKECYGLFYTFDLDKNGILTVQEAKILTPLLAPDLVGHEQAIVDLLDQDADGKLTLCDIFTDFTRVDTDQDGYKNQTEYQKRVEDYCKELDG